MLDVPRFSLWRMGRIRGGYVPNRLKGKVVTAADLAAAEMVARRPAAVGNRAAASRPFVLHVTS